MVDALVAIQFTVAMWQLLELTPVGLVVRALYLFLLEWLGITSQSSERIVINYCSSSNRDNNGASHDKLKGGGIDDGIEIPAGNQAKSSSTAIPILTRSMFSPIIHVSQTLDYFESAPSAKWGPADIGDEEEDPEEDPEEEEDRVMARSEFECTWLNRKLKFSREKDKANTRAYYVTVCELSAAIGLIKRGANKDSSSKIRRKLRFYVPDFPNRIWWDMYDYFAVRQNMTLKNKFKLMAAMEYAELYSYEEVVRKMIVKGERVCNRGVGGGPAVYIPKPKPKDTKLLACLNLIGIYGQLQDWRVELIAAITLLSSFLQFFAVARQAMYTVTHYVLVMSIQLAVDSALPLRWRALAYSFRDWLPGLQPSNDVQMRVVRGNRLRFFSVGNVECGFNLAKLDQYSHQPSSSNSNFNSNSNSPPFDLPPVPTSYHLIPVPLPAASSASSSSLTSSSISLSRRPPRRLDVPLHNSSGGSSSSRRSRILSAVPYSCSSVSTSTSMSMCLVGGFGNDKSDISSNPSDFCHRVALHICHLGGGALDYSRGSLVRLKSLKESFHRPYFPPHFPDHQEFAIWESTHYVVVR